MVIFAAFYAQLGAHFLAVAQIVVYAGAIMVLVLFVVMLLNAKVESLNAPGTFLTVVGVIIGGLFLYLILPLFAESFQLTDSTPEVLQGDVKTIGELLYSRYEFPFQMASLLIMAAVAGAVMLAKRRHKGLESAVTPNPGRDEFMRAPGAK